jgi:hypothetical protein
MTSSLSTEAANNIQLGVGPWGGGGCQRNFQIESLISPQSSLFTFILMHRLDSLAAAKINHLSNISPLPALWNRS